MNREGVDLCAHKTLLFHLKTSQKKELIDTFT